jgi:Ala-tRNA(Pro) deacylase
MIPKRITDYLDSVHVGYRRLPHETAITAQDLAAALRISGRRVAKSVIVEAEGQRFIAVLPANEMLDEGRLAAALGARSVRLLTESEFTSLFPDCDPGAEPPFGRLFDLPVVMDSSLADRNLNLIFRAGSHTEAVELRYFDFERMERPIEAAIGRGIAAGIPMRRPAGARMQPAT